jgi:hypothetical protein
MKKRRGGGLAKAAKEAKGWRLRVRWIVSMGSHG